MRNNDLRSRRIAVVSDRLLNAHLLGSVEDSAAMRVLEEQGFGLIQLPPDGAEAEATAAAIGFAVDQVQDYLKNGYAVTDAAGDGGSVAALFREECRSRGIDLGRPAPGRSR